MSNIDKKMNEIKYVDLNGLKIFAEELKTSLQNHILEMPIYEELLQRIAVIENRDFYKVVESYEELPNPGQEKIIYLVPNNGTFLEYLWVVNKGEYEQLGSFTPQLSLDQYLKIEDSPFEKGDAENSAVLKGEYQGYKNKAISQTSMAVGAGTIAGLKGWYYSKIDFTNKKITLSDKPTYILVGTTLINGGWSSGTPNINVGDKISIVNNSKYDYCGEVESVNGNVITYKDKLPFSTLTQDNGAMVAVRAGQFSDGYSIYLPDRPDAGIIDFGGGAFSEGGQSMATNICAHAEGLQTHAYGQYSHTEGRETEAGYAAHAEGRETKAIGESSHAEGLRTKTIDVAGHAEGADTVAGQKAHAEGSSCEATGYASHAEGGASKALGQYSHAEGKECEAQQNNSHAEGSGSKAVDQAAHAEGVRTEAGYVAHSEGYETKASGKYSHSEGYRTKAIGESAHVEGVRCNASNTAGHAEGYETTSGYLPSYTKATYYKCASKNKIWLTGTQTIPKVNETVYTDGYVAPFKVGDRVLILTAYKGTSVEFANTVIDVDRNVITIDDDISRSFHGESIVDNRSYSIINLTTGEGKATIDELFMKDVPGFRECGLYAHSEGAKTIAEGRASHAEGELTIAKGKYSHSGGYGTKAVGEAAYAVGYNTEAGTEYSYACGRFNKSINSSDESQATHFSIGIGISDTDRKNAFEVKQNGDIYAIGIGGYDCTNPSGTNDLKSVLDKCYSENDVEELVPVWENEYWEFDLWGNDIYIYVDGKYYNVAEFYDDSIEITTSKGVIRIYRGEGAVYFTKGESIFNSLGGKFIKVKKHINDAFIPSSIARKSDIATINGKSITKGGNIVIEEGSNWNANEGDVGYIKNRTHHCYIPEDIPLVYKDDMYIEKYNTGDESYPYGYKIAIGDNIGLYVYQYTTSYVGILNGSTFTYLNKDLLTRLKFYESGDYWDDDNCLIVETEFSDINECFNILNLDFSFYGEEVQYYKLSEKYIPDTIARKTELVKLSEKVENISPTPMISVTHAELKALRDNGELVAGMQYRITDYVTTCFSDIATSARHPFDIIVTALDSSHLSEEAKAIQRDGDEYFANSNLAAWKIWYCLDNDQTRFSWIKNAPYRIKISNGVDEAECYYLGPTDWFSNSYIIDKTVQSNICTADDWVILSLDAARSVRNGQEEESGQYEIIEESDWPKGVIYRMIDEYNNDLPYDFKNIIFKNKINERDTFFRAMSFYHNLITTYYTYTFFNKETQMDFYVATDVSCTKNVLNTKVYPTIISEKYEIVPTTICVTGCCHLTLHNNVHFVTNTELVIDYVEIEGYNTLNIQDITDYRFYNKRIAPRYNKLIVDGTEEFKYLGINIV